MAIENAKTLNVRIKNKYDSYENWATSGLVLEAGEIALCHTTVDVQVDGKKVAHPALLMKCGDGSSTFANLPWLSAKAADVLSVCKNEDELKTFVNGVIADAGIASSSAMEALAGKVTTAEGAIDALEALVGTTAVADQIDAKIAALNLADTYAAKTHSHAMTDVTGLVDAVADAKRAGTDAAAALETYKTTNNAAVEANAGEIATIKSTYATKTEAQGYADAKDTAIAAAKKAGDDAAAALEAYKGTNDAAVQANAGAITAIKDGASIDSFADVEAALAGKQATGDYATKSEAQGYATAAANGKDDAIKEAKDAADAAQGEVDALEEFVGELPEGATATTVVGYIEEKTANIASDATVSALADRVEAAEGAIDAIEADYLKAADKTELQGKINLKADQTALEAEAARADAAEKANADAIKAVADDYLKAADKTELEGKVTALENGAVAANTAAIEKLNGDDSVVGSVDYKVAQEVAKILNDNDASDIDTLEEIAAWIKNDTAGVGALNQQVQQNKADIATLNGTGEGSVDKKIADAIAAENLGQYATDGELSALDGRVTTAEGKITTLEGKMTTAEGEIDALQEKVDTTGTVSAAISAAIEALKIGDYAKAADLTAAVNRITTAEGDIDAVEGRMTTAEGEIDALQADIVKKANDADLAAVAKSGLIDDLTIGEGTTLVFDCGSSAI